MLRKHIPTKRYGGLLCSVNFVDLIDLIVCLWVLNVTADEKSTMQSGGYVGLTGC